LFYFIFFSFHSHRLELGRGSLDNGLDKTVGVVERNVDLGVLAGVLEAVVPAEIQFNVVLVREKVSDGVKERSLFENALGNVVHGGLDRGRVLKCKGLEGNVASLLVCAIKLTLFAKLIDSLVSGNLARDPSPLSIDIGRENTIMSLFQGGKIADVVSVEL